MGNSSIIFVTLLGIALLASACSPQSSIPVITPDGSHETLYISPFWKPCVGVGPMLCMQVKSDPDSNWQLFYNQIDGFTYEPGYDYEIIVKKEKVENPPADASSLKYTLVEEVSKSAAEAQPHLNQTDWKLVEIQGKSVLSEAKITLSFTKDGAVAGNAACNQYNASYTFEGGKLEVGPIATTRKACPEPIMQQETQFLAALEGEHYLQLENDQLLLVKEDMQYMLLERINYQLDTPTQEN